MAFEEYVISTPFTGLTQEEMSVGVLPPAGYDAYGRLLSAPVATLPRVVAPLPAGPDPTGVWMGGGGGGGGIPSGYAPGDSSVGSTGSADADRALQEAGLGGWIVIIATALPWLGQALSTFFQSGVVKKAIELLKGLWANKWLRIGAILAGAGLIAAAIWKWITGGRKRKKRYSIGRNPRLGTLIKVGRVVNTVTKQFVNQARHSGVLKVPHRTSYITPHRNGRRDLTVVR